MIGEKEVQHIADLARLNISQEEKKEFTAELSLILDYIKKLKEINVEKIKPTSHPLEIENVTRGDNFEKREEEISQKLLKAAPALENNYIKVKTIFKSSK